MKRILIFISCFIFIMTGIKVNASTDELPAFPDLVSQNVVLMDADTGEVLYSNNPDKKCYPASTTKLLTALLTIENSNLSDTVTYSENAVKSISAGDANASISIGEELTVEQSLYCLLLRSANDVAYGLGEYVGGTISGFATMMNDRATALGATNTHFTNPSGLTDEFHYSTPYDMALIARACMNNKTLMNILSYKGVYTIGPTNKSKFTRYYSHRFQMLEDGEYYYKYALGGKTGYTDAAGNCLITFAEKDGLRLICSIMGSTDSDRYTDTIALFEYYFNNYKKASLSGYNDELYTSDSFTLEFGDDAYILVPNFVNTDDLSSVVTYSDNPAYDGAENGFAVISFYYNDLMVGKATVYASTASDTGGVAKVDSALHYNSDDYTYINIYIVLGVFLGVGLIIFLIILYIKRNRKRLSYLRSKRKLHF